MASNKMRLPSSSAGITSFYNEYKSNFVLKPGHVVALILLVIVLELLLRTFA
jgi:preprotein translocase subunit Sec61beta